MRSIIHGPPASACWPCVSSSPLLPGALCSDGLLSPSSLLLRPHAPVSYPPANFPPRGYIAGLAGTRPSLLCIPGLATVPPPLRRRAPPGHPPDSSRRILPSPSKDRLGALIPQDCLRAGEGYRRCGDSVMLRPGRLLAPLGSPVLRRRGLYPRSFHRDGRPTSMSDSLRGHQAITAAGPSPAGLSWLQAAPLGPPDPAVAS
jgi:hypothetical protein